MSERIIFTGRSPIEEYISSTDTLTDDLLSHNEDDSGFTPPEPTELYPEQNDEMSDSEWEERKNIHAKYTHYEARYYIGRKFMIGDQMCEVWYTDAGGDPPNYHTKSIDMKNLDTGEMFFEITPDEVDAMIAAADRQMTAAENGELVALVEAEMTAFDTNAASERAQFEAFLYDHPELLSDEAEELPIELEKFRTELIESFDRLADDDPELMLQRQKFIEDLDHHIHELQSQSV